MEIPGTLKTRLREGKVIPFLGAGVSMAVVNKETDKRLFPSWKELLLKAADHLEEESNKPYADLVRSLLNLPEPEYLNAANYARKGLKGSLWADFLKRELSLSSKLADGASLELARLIWQLGSNLLITTNYDRVLHWASPDLAELERWHIQAAAEQSAALRNKIEKPTVWHLHGSIEDSNNLILTPDGYERLYSDEANGETKYQAALHTLRQFLTTHTFLFVGYSLDDYHLGLQLNGLDRVFQGVNTLHYALIREAEIDRVRALKLPIDIIPYESHGEPLLKLIREMIEVAKPKSSDTIEITDEPGEEGESTPAPIEHKPQGAAYDPKNSVFYVPFAQKGDQVVGREKALADVREKLVSGRRTAIGQTVAFEGLGGLGKTQLAVEYAYRFRDEYPNGVIWLNADQDIGAQLTDLSDKANWFAPQTEHKYKLDGALQRLRVYSDCLIVFDNVESADSLDKYLPEPSANPHIIITSRTETPGFPPILIDPLSPDLSVQMLQQEAGQGDNLPEDQAELSALREIATKLDGLPLALELAGAYVRYRHSSWQEYLTLLKNNLRAALPEKYLKGSFTKHEEDVYSTLKISDALLVEEPRLRDVLDLLTWSGSAPMSFSLMCNLLNIKGEYEISSALSLGVSLRLLQRSPDGKSYAIHRLVREVRREDLPLEGRQEWVKDICQRLGDWFEEKRDKFEELSAFEADIDHLQAWQRRAMDYAPEHAARLMWLQAYPPYHRGLYKETQKLLKKAHELANKSEKEDLRLKAHLLDNLGFTYDAFGDYKQSLENREKALKIRLERFGEKHPDTAQSLNNVGGIYDSLGDYKKALEYVGKALDIRLELFGEKSSSTAESLNNIGGVYKELGDYKKALVYLEKALAIHERLYGEKHPSTATSIDNVGGAYEGLGDYKKALEYEERALDIRLGLFGEKHPDTARSLSGVGVLYYYLGDYKKALEHMERALDIQLELFGEKYPEAASSLNSIGSTYAGLEDYEKALKYEEKALAMKKELYGEKHPRTAISLNNIGVTYGQLGNHKQALEYKQRALEIRRESLGEKHPDTAASLNNLAYTLFHMGRKYEAFKLLDNYLKELPRNHLQYDNLNRQRQQIHSNLPGVHQGSTKKKGKKRRW